MCDMTNHHSAYICTCTNVHSHIYRHILCNYRSTLALYLLPHLTPDALDSFGRSLCFWFVLPDITQPLFALLNVRPHQLTYNLRCYPVSTCSLCTLCVYVPKLLMATIWHNDISVCINVYCPCLNDISLILAFHELQLQICFPEAIRIWPIWPFWPKLGKTICQKKKVVRFLDRPQTRRAQRRKSANKRSAGGNRGSFQMVQHALFLALNIACKL